MGIFDFARSLLSDTQSLLGAVFVVAGLIIGIVIAVKGRGSVASAVMALIVGGVIAALGVIIVSLSGAFKNEITNRTGAAPVVHERVIDGAGLEAPILALQARR